MRYQILAFIYVNRMIQWWWHIAFLNFTDDLHDEWWHVLSIWAATRFVISQMWLHISIKSSKNCLQVGIYFLLVLFWLCKLKKLQLQELQPRIVLMEHIATKHLSISCLEASIFGMQMIVYKSSIRFHRGRLTLQEIASERAQLLLGFLSFCGFWFPSSSFFCIHNILKVSKCGRTRREFLLPVP